MTGARLRLEGVTKRHPGAGRPALDAIDLEIESGRALVLLGASGAGKTTLLRIVAGLDQADAGVVRIGDRVLSDPRVLVPPEQRGVGLVFQHLELWPHMTVAENIAFGLEGRPRGRAAQAHATVRDLAQRVGVLHLLARSPATLSGGERQRVAIARTLAPKPAVLLYDEPLANLDPERRQDLRHRIRTLAHEEGTTLVYVTHGADEAMEMGDEIAVLHEGRIVDRGPPAHLYRHPATLASARALGPVTALDATLHGGHASTALGDLAISPTTTSGDGLVLLRPESVLVGPEGNWEAQVLEAHPTGPAWTVTAEVAGVKLEARSEESPEVGARIRLRIAEPVSAVAKEGR